MTTLFVRYFIIGAGFGILYLNNRKLAITAFAVFVLHRPLLEWCYRVLGETKRDFSRRVGDFSDDESLASDETSESLRCPQDCSADSVNNETALFSYGSIQDPKGIRLLELLPAQSGQRLSGRIIHFILGDAPSYLAISYCWGSQKNSNLLWVDETPLRIGKNAHDVLHRLRLSDTPRLLWIDCVCINQTVKGDDEKPQQLDIMGDIYKKASKVVVYLGDAPDATHALWFTHCLYRTIWNPKDPSIPARTSKDWNSILRLLKQEWFERVWVVQEVVKASEVTFLYGSRSIPWDILATVVERISVPLDVNIRGLTNLEIDKLFLEFPHEMKAFRQAILMRAGKGRLRFLDAARNSQVQHNFNEDEEYDMKPNMSELLRRCGRLQASDPKDKIFALVGLSWETMRAKSRLTFVEIRPVTSGISSKDYSMSTQAIYTKLAMKLLTNDQTPGRLALEILPSAGIGYARSDKIPLPSWVPEWSSFPETNSLSFDLGSANEYCASGISSDYWHFHMPLEDANFDRLPLDIPLVTGTGMRNPRVRQYAHLGPKPFTIILHGIRCDKIDEIWKTPYDPRFTAGTDPELLLQSLVTWYDGTLKLAETLEGKSFSQRRSMLDAYWRTLCGDRSFLNRNYQSPADPIYLQHYQRQIASYRRLLAHTQESKPQNQDTPMSNPTPEDFRGIAMDELNYATMQATPFALSMRQHAGHRCFAITENGRMALVPPLAESGDLVCIILGAQTPFLLRTPTTATGQESSNIDHGMTAEAWETWFNEMYYMDGVEGGAVPGTVPKPSKVVMTEDNTFELVGECYVHGIMRGELMPSGFALGGSLTSQDGVEELVIV